MLVLDTNVIFEILRPQPHETVVRWFEEQPRQQLFTTAVTQAEILFGIALLPKGRRRKQLLPIAQAIFREDFADKVLAFGTEAAGYYAQIGAARRSAGRPISQFDAVIAAITRLHDAKLVTRNVADFEGCGIDVINPWG